jgi:hypothetical protein
MIPHARIIAGLDARSRIFAPGVAHSRCQLSRLFGKVSIAPYVNDDRRSIGA